MRVVAILAATCVLATGALACGGDDGTSGSPAGSTSVPTGVSTEVQAAIDEAYKGSFKMPPSDSPAPQRGKNVWYIPLASAVVDVRKPDSLYGAAKRIGWTLTECDGKFSPDTIVSCIRQAIADRADGIILLVVDCSNVKSALRDADRAGVMVVSDQGSDCNEDNPAEPKLFDAATRFQGTASDVPVGYLDFLRTVWARSVALAIINGTKGQARILDVYESDLLVTREQDKGIRKYLKELCPKCEIVETVEHTGAEIGAPLQQRIEQALARHPEVNAIFNPYDAVTSITMAAVQTSGRKDKIYNVGAEGQPDVLDAIRKQKGTADAATALALDWDLYAALDALNRLFHGQKEPPNGWPTGNGTQIVDADKNLPQAGKRFQSPIDFRTAYLKAWGLK